jgi:periplasmic divalent cation tolerance protein
MLLYGAFRKGNRLMTPILIYVTASNEDEAATIGRVLVEDGLVACANVIGQVRSIYRWEGVVQDEHEAVLIAKTTADQVEAVTAKVCALHSNTLPCVVALPILGGNPAFLEWVAAETTPGSHPPK